MQYLLRTRAPEHPLASYLPTLGGVREVDAGLPPALADLIISYRDELAALRAGPTTQTNEARWAALLCPGFGRAIQRVPDRPLHLIELGASARLLLLTDRYACRYTAPDGRAATYGPDQRDGTPGGAGKALVMECAVHSDIWPEPASVGLSVADRTGIDLAPIDTRDPAATDWLRVCTWPEQTERLTRLDAALTEVTRFRPRMIAGNMIGTLPGVLVGVPDDMCPASSPPNAVTYLDDVDRRELVEILRVTGQQRDLVVVLNEASQAGAELFLDHRPAVAGPPDVLSVGLPTLVSWRNGRLNVEPLARTGPHGQFLEWVAGR